MKKSSLVKAQLAARSTNDKAADSYRNLLKSINEEDGDSRAILGDSFQNFMMKLGVGADNASSGSSYGFNPISRNRTLLEWIHRGSWVGGLAVDVVADDMTRAGVDIKGDLEPKQNEEIEEEVTELGIWEGVNDAVKWARLYGGSLIVFLIAGQEMNTELDVNKVGKDQFKGVMVLDRWQVEPSLNDLVTEIGPCLGMPKYYRITESIFGSSTKVHYSRVIRLEGIRVPFQQRLMENLWGISVLERLYDRLIAFDSATQGSAQLVYKSYIRTYKIKGLRNLVGLGGKELNGLVNYVDMMRRFQGIEGITLLDIDDEFEGHSHTAFTGLSDALMQFGQQLSGALQIPLVRLFGQSPAGLNSSGESDLRTYYDNISQQQNRLLKVGVTKIYQMIAQSKGFKWRNSGYGIRFRSLWQVSDIEKADISSKITAAVGDAFDRGLVKKETALKALQASSEVSGAPWSVIDDEEIAEAKELDENPPDPEEGLDPRTGKPLPIMPGADKEEKDDKPPAKKDRKRMNDKALATLSNMFLFYGLSLVIENPSNSIRAGKDWWTKMPYDYGYIAGTKGADGDPIDCFVGGDSNSTLVTVINQKNAAGTFDETKCMIGFSNSEEAISAYREAYDGPSMFINSVTMNIDQFKRWLELADHRKPAV